MTNIGDGNPRCRWRCLHCVTLTQYKYNTSFLFNCQPHDNAQHIYIYCEETTCTDVTTFVTHNDCCENLTGLVLIIESPTHSYIPIDVLASI